MLRSNLPQADNLPGCGLWLFVRCEKNLSPLLPMTKNKSLFLLFVRCRSAWVPAVLALVFLMVFPSPGPTGEPPPTFTLAMHDSLLDIAADNVPLRDIITAMAKKSGLTLRFADQETELVSCHLKSVSLPEALEKILGNWNYAVLYRKNSQGRSVPDTLWVINRNPQRPTVTNMNGQPRLVPMVEKNQPSVEEHLKQYRKEDVAAVFADSEKILLDFDAEPVGPLEVIDGDPSSVGNEPLPVNEGQPGGIRVTRLSATSPLTEIGLQEGDQVTYVNGNPVGSAADLARSLSVPPGGDVSVIRITRLRDGQIRPIYLQLR